MKKLKLSKYKDTIVSDRIKYSRNTFALNDLVDAIVELQEELRVVKAKLRKNKIK